jgi:hypothetical protein
MAHYCVWSKDNDAADSYWVLAGTPGEARRLVALNVNGAAEAEISRNSNVGFPAKRCRLPASFTGASTARLPL